MLEMEIDAPISERMSSIPVRVGFSPTSVTVMREPGTIAAATRRNAAEEMSPGNVPLSGFKASKEFKDLNDIKDLEDLEDFEDFNDIKDFKDFKDFKDLEDLKDIKDING